MAQQRYLIALGSNLPHHRYGAPPLVLQAALSELAGTGLELTRASRVHATAPLGPSRRRFANAAAVIRTSLQPDALLDVLQGVERQFGRKRSGQRWRARVLDLDIVLWDGRCHVSNRLVVPHVAFRHRDFVLKPAATIAPTWRDPITGLTVRQLAARLTKPHRLPR